MSPLITAILTIVLKLISIYRKIKMPCNGPRIKITFPARRQAGVSSPPAGGSVGRELIPTAYQTVYVLNLYISLSKC